MSVTHLGVLLEMPWLRRSDHSRAVAFAMNTGLAFAAMEIIVHGRPEKNWQKYQ